MIGSEPCNISFLCLQVPCLFHFGKSAMLPYLAARLEELITHFLALTHMIVDSAGCRTPDDRASAVTIV